MLFLRSLQKYISVNGGVHLDHIASQYTFAFLFFASVSQKIIVQTK